MRVLAAAIALALGGCYSPAIDDCQFKCNSSMDCPDGTDCRSGFCRSQASGTCSSVTVDAFDPCPPAAPAPPSTCDEKFALPGGGCGVVCGKSGSDELSWVEARVRCGNAQWTLAILDTPEKLAAPPIEERSWVGAQRDAVMRDWRWLTGAPVRVDAWPNNTPPAPTNGDNCAALSGGAKRLDNNASCGQNEAFICTYP